VAVLASTTGQLDAVRAALVGFDDRLVDLEPVGDADGFAHELYDRLRQVDRLGCAAVIVVAPPPEGIGVAVRDRLTRAAAGE
jgi:L-threonylcarbamoyladenylate synthase